MKSKSRNAHSPCLPLFIQRLPEAQIRSFKDSQDWSDCTDLQLHLPKTSRTHPLTMLDSQRINCETLTVLPDLHFVRSRPARIICRGPWN